METVILNREQVKKLEKMGYEVWDFDDGKFLVSRK